MDLITAAAYIRVSTDSQTELSPDSQLKVINQYAKQHGYIVPKEYVYRDDGISGRHADKRPEFIKMIGTAKQKPSPFSAVLLWKFSRFARNQEESIFYKGMLRKNSIDVISVSEPIIDGVFGSLIERIIEWTDEYYSIRLSGEVKRGMTEKVERGQAVSIPSFGYDIVDKKYVINPATAPVVKQIFADYLNGENFLGIARKLNIMGIRTTRGGIWENRTVEYILRNPVYIGKIRWNPKRRTRREYDDPDIMIVDGIHEPIISKEIFDHVQDKIAQQKKAYGRYSREQGKKEYMLHGLVKCSSCGASLSLSNNGLQCIKYTHGKCRTSHYISLDKLNRLVVQAIEVAFITGVFDLSIKREAQPEIDYDYFIEKEMMKLKRIKDAYEDGVYTLEEFKDAKQQITEHVESLRASQDQARIDEKALREEFVENNKDVVQRLKSTSISESEKNEILRSCVEKITFDRAAGTVDIIFYI